MKRLKVPGEQGGGKGFTLVEILLVVLLLSFVAVLALPQSDLAYRRVQLRNAASDIAYLIRYAQGRAAADQRLLRLEFDEGFKRYWLLEDQETAGEAPVDIALGRLSGRWGKVFSVPAEISLECGQRTVDIHPDGRIEKAEIKVCSQPRCLWVVTGRQRGAVHVLEGSEE